MQVENSISTLLIEELQLGVKLNQCVHSQRRHDFSLMLSMLAADVRVHSQFSLPLTENEAASVTDASLRKALSVPDTPPLALQSLDDIGDFQQGKLVVDEQLASIRLSDALNPKALAFRDDVTHVPNKVMGNTSLFCQQKEKVLSKQRLPFNVNAWLKSVQETVVKSPMVELTS